MQEKMMEYARLLVEVGVNIQKGQNLVLSAPVECATLPGCAPGRPMPPAAGRSS